MKEYIIINNPDFTINLKEISNIIDVRGFYDAEGIAYIMKDFYNLDVNESENAYLVCLDYDLNIKCTYLISKGNFNSCNIYKRSIAAILLLTGTRNFWFIHNHPTNNITSSGNDIANDLIFKSLSDLLEVNFLGSIIIGKDGWCIVGNNKIYEWEE